MDGVLIPFATPSQAALTHKTDVMTTESQVTGGTEPAVEPRLEISGSRQLTNWMADQKVSLGFTTYQTGKVFLIGVKPDDRLSVFERTFNRCMGLCSDNDGQTL